VSELVARAPRYTIVKAKVETWVRESGTDGRRLCGAARPIPEAGADTQDGLRLAWPDRWLHVRPSGTEPIIRFIAERHARRRRKTDRRRAAVMCGIVGYTGKRTAAPVVLEA